jgi:Right handed beta helix region
LAAVLVVLFLALPLGAEGRPEAASIHVRSNAEFAAAVAALRYRGGTIHLRRHVYRGELVVPSRSTRRLRIVGERGVIVESLLLDHTQHVTVKRVTIKPVTDDGWLKIYRSKHIELNDVLVTAAHTRLRATVHIPNSSHVLIRNSEFRRCGDRSELFSNCLHLQQRARHITVLNSWFHDCRGCDFIHGKFGYGLTLRGNRFERALPCRMNRHRCGHQDLVSLWSGSKLLVEDNTFGVYRSGAAQLYLIGAVDRVTIVNNVFKGTDPRVPGYHARVAIIVGSKRMKRVPRRVRIVNNTILTGAKRIDGYAGSIRMSGVYWRIQRHKRPLLVNNVIGLVEEPHYVCSVARLAISNVVLRGRRCNGINRLGRAHLDARGRPTAASALLIDQANRRFGARRDIAGRLRDEWPDIGAYEYRPR